ncbi:MAG TPA: peptidoglycan DD-metalloendopeptidase family protein [Steroidobacteraceae bacterium]|nr:peptidoglycan DD-metalloendopeptidase family protein [Steroidobacteraceae bacterium]
MSLTRAIAVAGLCCIMIGGCASGGPYEPATYVVRPEDTLYSIAWRHNLDYRAIAKWNNIGTDYRVSIGQVLVLQPSGESRAPRASQPATSAGARETRTGNVPSVGKPVPLADPPAGVGLPNGSQRAFGPATKESALVPAPMPAPAPVPVPTPAPVPSPVPASRGQESVAAPASKGANSKWVWPTNRLSAPRPVPGGGILLLGRLGQDVRAAGSGRVVYTGSGLRGYGNLIIIKHGDSLLSSYAHNRELLVHEGQDVAAGQVIAHMGMGPHQISALYFEIRVNGKPTDPLRYLRAAP